MNLATHLHLLPRLRPRGSSLHSCKFEQSTGIRFFAKEASVFLSALNFAQRHVRIRPSGDRKLKHTKVECPEAILVGIMKFLNTVRLYTKRFENWLYFRESVFWCHYTDKFLIFLF
jgi:hypothetical protein